MILAIGAGALGDLVFLPAVLKLFPEIIAGSRKLVALPVKVVSKRWFSSVVLALGALTLLFSNHAKADEAQDLLRKARQSLEAKSDQATVTLKIIEANGDIKERKISLKAMHDSDGVYHAKARILSPADVKGTALLAEIKGGQESQWLYLPSNHQVRRIVSGTKSAGILGSELNPDDLNSSVLQGSSATLAKKDATHAYIDVKPGASLEFEKATITLTLPAAIPEKIEYYRQGKVMKSVEFKDYKIVAGQIQRAQLIVVKNLVNHRGTDVQLTDLKVNSALTAKDFSVSGLQAND